MSKKIMLLFMFTIVATQTNFAMEQKRSSMVLTKLMDGRFDKGLIVNRFSSLHHLDKKSQAIRSHLQELESKKNDLEHENGQIAQDIEKDRDGISKNATRQIACVATGMAADVLTGGISCGFLTALGASGSIVIEDNNVELLECIKQNTLRLEGNNERLGQINYDESRKSSELIKVTEQKNGLLALQVLIKKGKVKLISINYSRPIDDVTGIDTFSKKSDYIYRQICESQDPYSDSYSYHDLIIRQEDSLDCFPGFWTSENSSDFSMNFCVSDEELSDESFLRKRPFTKNGNRIVVIFENSFDLINFFSGKNDSDDECLRCNAGQIICVRIISDEVPQETSSEGPVLEVPSESDWDSDALEYHHNWSLLTDDTYLPYTNVQDFLHAQNNS